MLPVVWALLLLHFLRNSYVEKVERRAQNNDNSSMYSIEIEPNDNKKIQCDQQHGQSRK